VHEGRLHAAALGGWCASANLAILVRWAIRIANQNYVGGGDALRIDERAVA